MWADDCNDRQSPISDGPSVLANSYKAGGYLRVYGFTVYSSLAAAQWIQMFDSATVPADTATPIIPFPISANNQVSVYYGPMGRLFRRGLILCNSTTETTKTIGAANCLFDVEYDFLQPPAPYPSGAEG